PGAAGRRYEIRVGQVLRTIGIGQARRLGVAMQEISGRDALFQRRYGWQVLQHSQDLHLGNMPRGRRWEAADAVALLPEGAHGFELAGLVAIKVGESQVAGIARMPSDLLDHGFGVTPSIKGLAAVLSHFA